MTTISNAISLRCARPLDMSNVKRMAVWEQSQEQYDRFVDALEAVLESRHAVRPDTSRNPAYAAYATVRVGGEVVAEIDNHGWVKTSNKLAAKLGHLPNDSRGAIEGPGLARARAQYCAERLGGELVLAPTAMTETAFAQAPQPVIGIDLETMQSDPLYLNLQRIKESRARFLDQSVRHSSMEATA